MMVRPPKRMITVAVPTKKILPAVNWGARSIDSFDALMSTPRLLTSIRCTINLSLGNVLDDVFPDDFKALSSPSDPSASE